MSGGEQSSWRDVFEKCIQSGLSREHATAFTDRALANDGCCNSAEGGKTLPPDVLGLFEQVAPVEVSGGKNSKRLKELERRLKALFEKHCVQF